MLPQGLQLELLQGNHASGTASSQALLHTGTQVACLREAAVVKAVVASRKAVICSSMRLSRCHGLRRCWPFSRCRIAAPGHQERHCERG